MSIRTFCDICGNELTRNMVDERLLVNSHAFEAEVLISKNGVANEGDLCLNCLLKMLNQKPKRKYERKVIAATNQTQLKTSTPETVAISDLYEPISTFSVVTGQDGKSHTFNMGGTSVSNKTLRAGAKELLGLTGLTEKDAEDAPESEGKRNLLGILNTK